MELQSILERKRQLEEELEAIQEKIQDIAEQKRLVERRKEENSVQLTNIEEVGGEEDEERAGRNMDRANESIENVRGFIGEAEAMVERISQSNASNFSPVVTNSTEHYLYSMEKHLIVQYDRLHNIITARLSSFVNSLSHMLMFRSQGHGIFIRNFI